MLSGNSNIKIGICPINHWWGKEPALLVGSYDIGTILKKIDICHKDVSLKNICFLKSAWEILCEKFQFEISSWKDFDAIFRINGKYQWIIDNDSVVFVVNAKCISSSALNKKICEKKDDEKKDNLIGVEWRSINNGEEPYSSDKGKTVITLRTQELVSPFLGNFLIKNKQYLLSLVKYL